MKTIWLSQQMEKNILSNTTSFYDKNLKQSRYRRKIPQYNQDNIWKTQGHQYIETGKIAIISTKIGTRKLYALSQVIVNVFLKGLARAIRQEKINQKITNWKGGSYVTTVYWRYDSIEETKDTRLELVTEFDKIAGYKINTQNICSFCISKQFHDQESSCKIHHIHNSCKNN